MISACFDDKNPERQFLTQRFFEEVETFDAYVSEVVLAEIDKTRDAVLKKRLRIVNLVNASLGYPDLKIATPAELI